MSTQVIASLSSILAVVLPLLGVEVGSEQLTIALSTIVVVVAGLWNYAKRVSQDDVNLAGIRN